MNRNTAIQRALSIFEEGSFYCMLADWVALDTSSQGADKNPAKRAYLEQKLMPYLADLDMDCRIVENAVAPGSPFLIGRRIEDESLPTILMYGHGDTVPGMAEAWAPGLSPLTLTRSKGRWYGRGTADNKGQHAINLVALDCVIREKGRLGFNVIVLIESGEEEGSPGLHTVCEKEKAALTADALIASDGTRIDPEVPTIFGGSRAVFNFDLCLTLRDGSHHSGNWGGLLANPGIILSHAIATLVDAKGKIQVAGLRPGVLPEPIKAAIDRLTVTGTGGPKIDPTWGEPGLSAAHKVYGWNTLDVLAFECGNPSDPANAIPPSAWARCHIRFIAGCDPETFIPAIRTHLDAHGFSMVEVVPVSNNYGNATRMAPDHPWVKFATASFENTLEKSVTFLPNLGGTLPNDAFSQILGMPTIWVPHSYGGCNQHAPNEHLLPKIVKEGLQIMAGLFWDLGEHPGIEGLVRDLKNGDKNGKGP